MARRDSLLFAAAIAALLMFSSAARGAPDAHLFLDHCSGCHSIGDGDLAGPDLLASAGHPREQVRADIERMMDNTGPLTANDIEALTDLLLSPDARNLVLTAANPPAAPPKPAGSATAGRRLFFGEQRFANGGTACFACHASGGRGGSLAVDLSAVHSRMSEAALVIATTKPPFPLMRAAYASHAVTEAEARDLAAFFRDSAATHARENAAPGERPATLHTAASGVAAIALGAVAFVFRSRRAGVRERMVRKTMVNTLTKRK